MVFDGVIKFISRFFTRENEENDSEPESEPREATDIEKKLQILDTYIEDKIEIFLLNNLLLSVQFFENYEREIEQLKSEENKKESSINNALKGQNKHVLLPNVVLDLVNQRVRFRPEHGPNKQTSHSLAPQRLFVFYDNIITNPVFETEEPKHLVVLEDAKRQGHVILKRTQVFGQRSPKSPKFSKNSPKNKAVKFSFDDAQTVKPILKSSKESYFESKQVAKPLKEEDFKDEEDEFDENGKRKPPVIKEPIKLYETKYFVNSQKFLRNFQEVFDDLHTLLGFADGDVQGLVEEGGVFCVDQGVGGDCIVAYEVHPAVESPWPEMAAEWSQRRRKDYLCSSAAITWPRKKWVEKIIKPPNQTHVAVLPINHSEQLPEEPSKKVPPNEEPNFEWNLLFPEAEQFLDLRMTHGQTRCYLFILALYKTYLQIPNKKPGLHPYHIKTVILWEVEKNWTNWQEEILGDKMYQVLTVLYEKLSEGRLDDYFNPKRNLFSDLPRKYLLISQERLFKILENPFFYTLAAVRNLRYTPHFFPTLDYKTLYKSLTTVDSSTLVNPDLARLVRSDPRRNAQNEAAEKKKQRREQKMDLERLWKIKSRMQYEQRKKENEKKKNERRGSVDSINLEVNTKDIKFDDYRKRALIEFFVNHYINMARYCISYKSFDLVLTYLNYGFLLQEVLTRLPSGILAAGELMGKLRAVNEEYKEAMSHRGGLPSEEEERTHEEEPQEVPQELVEEDVQEVNTSIEEVLEELEELSKIPKNVETNVLEVVADVHVPKKEETKKPKSIFELLKEEIEEKIENKEILVAGEEVETEMQSKPIKFINKKVAFATDLEDDDDDEVCTEL